MATGTLQQSGDKTAQLEQLITTLGGTPYAGNIGELLKQINSALTGFAPPGSTLPLSASTSVAENIPRSLAGESVTIATTSGVVYMMAVYIPSNTVVNNVTVVTGSTASSNDVTINWAALCDNTRKVLAVSANATAQLTPAGFKNTLALSAPYTTTRSGLYYVAYTVGATTTQPTVCGVTSAGTEVNAIVPILCGQSATGSTSTPPAVGATLGAITAEVDNIYTYLT
jgi:hypothetical protein